ncbi:MAG: hypothetical protein ACREVK_01300 [Gammaproteobacteria bacterium]
MQRGVTRGKVAQTVAGTEAIEIKATIPGHQVEAALARYALTVDNDQERYIYFFDTPALDLLRAGIIARARRIVDEEHDSTVKLRPVVPAEVPEKWRKYSGFKIEADASEKGVVKSTSFTMPVAKGFIKQVAAGKISIAKLFTNAQETFLSEMADRTIDYASLETLGPLQAHRWKFEDPACPWEIIAELWRREDGARLMEASIKAPVVQAAAALGGFMAFLAEVGAEQDRDQQAKTRWALNYYTKRTDRGRRTRGR